ncbi:hypothetical protein DV451_004851 [Geotrichum candidum]|uniref:Uncharacterized protein n=1 Tax=Geotrichum candidum TaxID=1173061 RepID=A0A9P5KS79_GEOCN|nr:hypothetical protein DV451_004851 [Geotrichum candidum]KAF5108105.1 hypothetical protein DV453_002543 [Geotrichum candidum]KAF5110041.1 hypothetical protein DV454_004898 [Geotrichum candidum]KAF5119876.1 hypothetical protein DV495_004644 [Geotrichum candidum]KAF7499503.1 hypothetical protein DV113_002496 [Geotrichum candidum]
MLRNISRTGLRTARSFKPQIVAKRFSHGDHHGEKHGHDDHHHDDHHHEYPPELNSKDGKSLVGNWLIPSSDRAAIEAAEDAKVEQYLKAREDKIAERKPIPQSPFKDYSIM